MNNYTIRVCCLQVKARPFSEQTENKENILQLIAQAARCEPDLIMLPECVYPCYFLSSRIIPDYKKLGLLTTEFVEEIKVCARNYQTFIAVGFPEYIPETDFLYNTALLIDDEGKEVGRYRKSFLWHFDNNWFKNDSNYPVFDTKIGKIGLFICADGRLPEVARSLSLRGAEILLDLTNWITSGLERKNWSNPQVEYMVPTRALENKVWIAAANKVGFEENSIQYCGKSAFFSPEGETIMMASTDEEEILAQDIDLSHSHQKSIPGVMDLFQSRRPELYHYLTSPCSELPIYRNSKMQSNKDTKNPFAAVIQIEEPLDEAFSTYLAKMEDFFHTLAEQQVDILSFAQFGDFPASKSPIILNLFKDLTKTNSRLCTLVLPEKENSFNYKTFFIIQSGKIIAKYRKTHLELDENGIFNQGENEFPVFETQFGTIGMMLDYEGYFPEIARILSLKGADLIIWSVKFARDEHLKISQTRSAENKVFILCPNSMEQEYNGHSIITAPSGQIIAGCLEKAEIASVASLSLCLSRDKNIVPGTNAIFDRQPASYQLLTSKKTLWL